jgi:hypothetical protein
MYLPAGITVHEGDLDLFQQYVHPAFKVERLILVTNQFGDNKIAIYGMGQLAPGKTIADIAASKGVVPAGTGDSKGIPRPGPTTVPGDTDEFPVRPTTTPSVNTASPVTSAAERK